MVPSLYALIPQVQPRDIEARMTRREGMVAAMAWFSLGFVPACTHTMGVHPDAKIAASGFETGGAVAATTPHVESPYQPLPPPAPAKMNETHRAEVITPVQPALEKPLVLASAELGTPLSAEPIVVSPVFTSRDDHPRPAEDPALVRALRCFLDKRPDQAIEQLGGYEKSNQDLLLCLLPLMARLTSGSLQGDPLETALLLDQLDGCLVPLRSRAALEIQKLCFCQRIETFGVFTPLPADHCFQPNDMVQIYVELRNFSSQLCQGPSGESTYCIHLASSAEIRDEAGRLAWPGPLRFERRKADESHTQRQDYFESYRFPVPALKPGNYKLWVEIQDLGTDPARKVRQALEFRVTSPSRCEASAAANP